MKEAGDLMNAIIQEAATLIFDEQNIPANPMIEDGGNILSSPKVNDRIVSLREQNVGNREDTSFMTVQSVTSRPKIISRKPRSLIFSKNNSYMFSTSLDGSIQSWSMSSKNVSSIIHLPSLLGQSCFAEDICFNDKENRLVIAFGEPSKQAESFQNQEKIAPNLSNRLYYLDISANNNPSGVILQPTVPIHTKGISVVEPFYNGPSNRSIFVTGGTDKVLALWDVDENGRGLKCIEIHRRHTSSIQAMAQQLHTKTLWTGGSDWYVLFFDRRRIIFV